MVTREEYQALLDRIKGLESSNNGLINVIAGMQKRVHDDIDGLDTRIKELEIALYEVEQDMYCS